MRRLVNGVYVRYQIKTGVEGSKWLGEGEVNSLTLQKP